MKWLAAAGAFILTLLAALGMARQSGKDVSKRDQSEKDLKKSKRANEIDDTVRDTTDSDLDKRLRKYRRD